MAGTGQRVYVARSGTSLVNSTSVALVAATAKTVLAVMGTAATTLSLNRVRVSFDSVTATHAPALVEVAIITANGTGTNWAAANVPQVKGSTLNTTATVTQNMTVEPAYASPSRVIESTFVPIQNGLYDVWYPLGDEPQADPSQGFAIRITSPAAVNCYPSLYYAE